MDPWMYAMVGPDPPINIVTRCGSDADPLWRGSDGQEPQRCYLTAGIEIEIWCIVHHFTSIHQDNTPPNTSPIYQPCRIPQS